MSRLEVSKDEIRALASEVSEAYKEVDDLRSSSSDSIAFLDWSRVDKGSGHRLIVV